MTSKLTSVLAALTLATACGGGGGGGGTDTGGVDPDEKASDLTAQQAMDLCAAYQADFPAKTVDCGSGNEVGVGFGSDSCTDFTPPPAGCPATVGQATDCFQALYDDACGSGLPPACADVDTPACDG